MSSRIKGVFDKLKKENKKALITYVTAGDPNIKITEELVYAMEGSGADIIELGIPYSDPLADGPVIQQAANRALGNGINIDTIFDCVTNIRKNSQIPLVFLLYYNSIFRYGIKKFLDRCKKAGIDALIIPDLPLEERKEMYELSNYTGVDLIPLVAPTSEERIHNITKVGSGFVYCVSSLGITGERNKFDGIEDFMKKVRDQTTLPLAIGFGISDNKAIKELKDKADGLIVGSAIVRRIEEGLKDNTSKERVGKFVRELKEAFL